MKKKILSILTSASMVLMLASCGSSTPAPSAAPASPSAAAASAPVVAASPSAEASTAAVSPSSAAAAAVKQIQGIKKARPAGGFKFGYTCMDGTNPYFVALEKSISDKVKANGDSLISVDPANDSAKQITQIEDLITQHIDAIFLNPVDAQGIKPALDDLKKAGIPIINFDAQVADLDYCISYVGSDNYNAGKVDGEDLVKNCPKGGPIIVLDSPTMNSVVDRTNGFKDAIKGHGFDIVAEQDAKGNLQQGMNIAQDLLQAHGDVVAIFGGNDPTALGALAAANAANIKNCRIYGVDGSPDIKKELAKGNSLIAGTGAQSPITIGTKSTEVMYEYLSGKTIDSIYPVKTFLITNDNVKTYGTDGWQ